MEMKRCLNCGIEAEWNTYDCPICLRELESQCPSDAPASSESIAEVAKRIVGRIASIEVGEIVKVTHNDGQTCTVERETWRGSLVEINNRVVGVPVNCLKFRPQNSELLIRELDEARKQCGRMLWALKRIGYVNGVGIPKHDPSADIAKIAIDEFFKSQSKAAGTDDEKPDGQAENVNMEAPPRRTPNQEQG